MVSATKSEHWQLGATNAQKSVLSGSTSRVRHSSQPTLPFPHGATEIRKKLEASLSIKAYFDLKWHETTSCALRQKLHAKVTLESLECLTL